MATIVHVDLDAFFAAIEQKRNPEYQNKPVIVGGLGPRGVVSTCSYEARKYGVRSAMPMAQARKLCPHAVFLPPDLDYYHEISTIIHRTFYQFTPVVEHLSVDEAFLDMTGCEHFYKDRQEMGQTIKSRIWSEVGLTASVGIAPNMFLAKIASDLQKPDGLVIIDQDNVHTILDPLPVSKIWGVGAQTQRQLQRYGIHTIKDVRTKSPEYLARILGNSGPVIWQLANGIDHRQVTPNSEAKSISHETTFSTDTADLAQIKGILAEQAAAIGHRLRAQCLSAQTITLKARYNDFYTVTRSTTKEYTFQDDDTIYYEACRLLERLPRRNRPFRLIGVGVSKLSRHQQASLFEDESKRRLSLALDRLTEKYQAPIVHRGTEMKKGQGKNPDPPK